MLSAGVQSRRVASLDRLDAWPAPAGSEPDWTAPIDRTRWFVCETITPLYYTSTYRLLAAEHRRRYNQLTGMLSNELILRLETGILDAVLGAIARAGTAIDPELVRAVERFRDDERRHAQRWRGLNRLSEPAWYSDSDQYLLHVPRVLDAVTRRLAAHPATCGLVLWMQLAQEERSIEISKRCLRVPADAIEPRYAAVYGEHLRDEVRHVQVDCHLIERLYATQSRSMRLLTARTFRWLLSDLFLTPARSTIRVLHVLVSEYPVLAPLLGRMTRDVRALTADARYQRMMYSRTTTPLTFALFDAFPEFHCLRTVLSEYAPPAPEVAR